MGRLRLHKDNCLHHHVCSSLRVQLRRKVGFLCGLAKKRVSKLLAAQARATASWDLSVNIKCGKETANVDRDSCSVYYSGSWQLADEIRGRDRMERGHPAARAFSAPDPPFSSVPGISPLDNRLQHFKLTPSTS